MCVCVCVIVYLLLEGRTCDSASSYSLLLKELLRDTTVSCKGRDVIDNGLQLSQHSPLPHLLDGIQMTFQNRTGIELSLYLSLSELPASKQTTA